MRVFYEGEAVARTVGALPGLGSVLFGGAVEEPEQEPDADAAAEARRETAAAEQRRRGRRATLFAGRQRTPGGGTLTSAGLGTRRSTLLGGG